MVSLVVDSAPSCAVIRVAGQKAVGVQMWRFAPGSPAIRGGRKEQKAARACLGRTADSFAPLFADDDEDEDEEDESD